MAPKQDTKGTRANGGKKSAEDYLKLEQFPESAHAHMLVCFSVLQSGWPIKLQHLLHHKEKLEHWVSLNSANFIFIEERDKKISDSKFDLRPFSSVEAASIMETE